MVQKGFLFVFTLLVLTAGRTSAQKVWKNVGAAHFSAGHITDPAMTVDNNGIPYVVFADSSNGNKATVMKYNGTSWMLVGTGGISAGGATACSIKFDRLNNIYVTYADVAQGSRITVKKYVSSTWITMGTEGFSVGSVSYPSLAIDGFNVPYVAYTDDYFGYGATVMKFSETTGTWATLGGHNFAGGQVGYIKMAVDTGKLKMVVFEDFNHGNSASVMAYNDTANYWYFVDSTDISHGWAVWTDIVCDTLGTVYISYQDCTDSNRISVRKFSGTHWQTVGSRGFSVKAAQYPAIALDHSGMPYVVYNDWNLGSYATVMNFDGTAWVTSGTQQGFSAGAAKFTTISVDQWGTPYVGFMDSARKTTVMKLGTAPIAGNDSICLGPVVHMTDITPGGTWTSSNPAVATIDVNTGFVNTLTAGTTTISYNIPRDAVGLVVTVTACSVPAAVTEVNQANTTLSVFPDPNHGAFTLHISAAQNEPATITITNMMGQIVKELTTTTNTNAPVQIDAAPGVYFISAITAQGRQSAKVVVE